MTGQDFIDINTASPEELAHALHAGADTIERILRHRPYENWDDFQTKNPGFSEATIQSLKKSGVIVGAGKLNRAV